ncbi:hypothetical protein [Escherichia coli]|uniref:hypothetical protein n=1 Tax=Escherichia coli TaxID=562 RepID=UPI00058A0B93|nr:hypothetical protein [Escherichia coli]ANP05259.1 hypothetical protein CP48_p00060 [Escherichia coli]KIH33827.1 hypothetical protein PD07_23020 [Escherichia coli]GDJ89175.1 putative phage protein [Escherichia coli]GDK07031.1 putative phage protein [Escherichia coli]
MFNVITHPTALDELLELPDNLRGRMARRIERLEQEGNKMKMPHSVLTPKSWTVKHEAYRSDSDIQLESDLLISG